MATYSITTSKASVEEGGQLITTVHADGAPAGTIIYYALDTAIDQSVDSTDLAAGTIVGQATIQADGTAQIVHQLAEDWVADGDEYFKLNLYSDKPRGTLVYEGVQVLIKDTTNPIFVETERYQGEDTPFAITKWASPVTVPSLKLPEYIGNGVGPWGFNPAPSADRSGAPALYQDVDPTQELYGGMANEFFEYNISSDQRTTPYFSTDDPVYWYSQYEIANTQVVADGADQQIVTPIYGYDGTYPGTTFKTKVGQPVVVRHYNDLPPFEGINPEGFPQRESIHLHGGHNPSHSDGYSSYVVNPGMYRDYYYANTVPNREDGQPDFSEAPSTMWYHDHGEDLTDLHVIQGMSGFWLSYDEYELDLVKNMVLPGWSNKDANGNPVEWDEAKFMSTNSKYDIALAISDRTFNADGSFFYDGSPVGDNIDGYLGDVAVINGKSYPFLVVEPTQTRLRMLGASTGRIYQLSIQDEAGTMQEHLRIGNDTWLNGEPLAMEEFTLSMAQRADVVMDFSKYEPGTVLYLVNTAEQHSGRGPVGKLNDLGDTGFSDRIMKIVVGEATPSTPTYNLTLDTPLREHHEITRDMVTRTRQFEFGRRGGMWVINQQAWEHERVDNAITLGNAEQWNLINGSGGWWHPIHIHLESHQVLTIEGQEPGPDYWPEKQWKSDTTLLGPNTTAEIVMNFRTFEGGFVFHCHNLNHEDSMMMYNFWTQLYDGFFQEGAYVTEEFNHSPDYFPLMHDPAHTPGIHDGPTNSIDPVTGIDHSTSADIAVGTTPTRPDGSGFHGTPITTDPAAGGGGHAGHEGHLGQDVTIGAPSNLTADVMAAFSNMLWGSEDDDVITPSADDNFWGDSFIHGGGGNDRINGYYGNDVLVGGTGDDYLDGGTGMDMAIYGTNVADLAFDLVGGELQISNDIDGTDILRSVEMLLTKDGVFHFAPGASDSNDVLSYSGQSRVVLFGGKGDDELNGNNWDDVLFVNAEGSLEENAANGRDLLDGGNHAERGDHAIIRGDAKTETYRIYAIASDDETSINASYREELKALYGDLSERTETVVLRAIGEVAQDQPLSAETFQLIAEISRIEEYTLNLGEASEADAVQRVQLFGDFSETDLLEDKITILSKSATDIDVTALISDHRIVLLGEHYEENTITGRRPQDQILYADCDDCPEHSAITIDFNEAENGDGIKIYTTDSPGAALRIESADSSDGDQPTTTYEALSDSLQDNLLLGGKLDYDGELDSDKSDDNYEISFDGKSLKIKSRATGSAEFKGFEWVNFGDSESLASYHHEVGHEHDHGADAAEHNHEECAEGDGHDHADCCGGEDCEEGAAAERVIAESLIAESLEADPAAAHEHDHDHGTDAAAHNHDECVDGEACEEGAAAERVIAESLIAESLEADPAAVADLDLGTDAAAHDHADCAEGEAHDHADCCGGEGCEEGAAAETVIAESLEGAAAETVIAESLEADPAAVADHDLATDAAAHDHADCAEGDGHDHADCCGGEDCEEGAAAHDHADCEHPDEQAGDPDGSASRFYYKEFAEKAIDLGLSLVKQPVFTGDSADEIVLRQFGNEAEQGSKFYLAISAESLRDSSINTLDFTVDLGHAFGDVFELKEENIFFTDDLNVQRRVEIHECHDGTQSIRFAGAGLESLGTGHSVSNRQVLAYVALEQRGDINDLIKAERSEDVYGFMNTENFSVPLSFSVDANIDSVVWQDQYSLRDLGGQYAMLNPDLEVVARSAQAELVAEGSFDLGTQREIRQYGEGEFSNLVRRGDTIMQSNTWQNNGEFTFTDMKLTSLSNSVADVSAQFSNGTDTLAELGWSSEVGQGEVAEITTTFQIIGEAGSVVDTNELGYKLEAYGDFMWDSTQIEQFQVKHLVTFQGDLNYDGRVGMKDLAALEAGARASSTPHDVDANFDGTIDINDLSIIDADWNQTLHQGDQLFAGVSSNFSMMDLFEQNGRHWDSSAFAEQNAIESGVLRDASQGHERAFIDEMEGSSGVMAAGLDQSVVSLIEEHNQQYALTTV